MTEKAPGSQSWWQTIPGMLTGLAAVITAITGLIVAFHRPGDANGAGKSASQTPAGIATAASPAGSSASPEPNRPATAAAAAGAPSSQRLKLPALTEVKLAGGQTVIKILSAELEPFNAEKRALRIAVRHTNLGRYPANFWGASYRLIVDDVPRAPTNSLNEVVAGESAAEGEVVFEVPADAGQA